MPLTFQHSYDQHQLLTKFQSSLEPPAVSYEYTSTVASKLFNFASTLSNLNVSDYLSNPQTCHWQKFRLCYEPHGHVITGDLKGMPNRGNLLLKDQNTENQIRSTGELQKQCFWNPLISMQKIGPKENK